MRQYVCILTMAAAGPLIAAQTPAGPSATARVAFRVEELSHPSVPPAEFPGQPVAWPGARAVERPQLVVDVFTGVPPRPSALASAKPPMPRPMPEGQPPVAQTSSAQRVELPSKPLVQVPALDVETPLPLPILAKPKPDRASLDDTTLEASQAAALERVRPRRTERVPFAPVNLPDPFENVRTGAVRNPPEESDQPPPVPIRTPGR
jgi:hypothetical protein